MKGYIRSHAKAANVGFTNYIEYRFDEKSDDVWQDTFILRVNRPFPLGDGWKIGTRLDIPLVLTNKSSGDNPNGKDTFGLGDIVLQGVLIDEFSKRWAAGLGPRLVLPTADQDQFGSGRVQLGPIGGVRYSLPELSATACYWVHVNKVK